MTSAKRTAVVGYYVEVEVDAIDLWDASSIASTVTEWIWSVRGRSGQVIHGDVNGQPYSVLVRKGELLSTRWKDQG